MFYKNGEIKDMDEGIVFPRGENAEIWKAINIANYGIENSLKAQHTTIKLLWFIATMSVISAINSIGGASVLYKAMLFMLVGLAGLIISRHYT